MRKTRIVSILDTPVPPFPVPPFPVPPFPVPPSPLSAASPAKRVAVKAKKFPS